MFDQLEAWATALKPVRERLLVAALNVVVWIASILLAGLFLMAGHPVTGKHKSDVIDADVLARAGEVFDLHPLRAWTRRSWRCVGPVCGGVRR